MSMHADAGCMCVSIVSAPLSSVAVSPVDSLANLLWSIFKMFCKFIDEIADTRLLFDC